jgi:hypothetical protein
MNIKYFAASYIADCKANEELVFPLLYKLAPKELLDNQNLPSNFIRSIWFNLSAKERTNLAYRKLESSDLDYIVNKEDKTSVLKVLVSQHQLTENQATKLFSLDNEALIESIYQYSKSTEIKKLAASKLRNLTYLKEELNWRTEVLPDEVENFLVTFEKLNPSRELNLYIGFYLHKYESIRDVAPSLPFDSKVLGVYVGSPYLTPSTSEEIVARIKLGSTLPSKYLLMALVANPRTSHKALLELKDILGENEETYEVKQILVQSLLKDIVEKSYTEIDDLVSYNRVFKRSKTSSFKPAGRILDLLILSENVSLPSESREEILRELKVSANEHSYLSYKAIECYQNFTPEEIVREDVSESDPIEVDPRYLEMKLSNISFNSWRELSYLLNTNFGSCDKTWSTALMIFNQYDGTLDEFINTSKNI